MWKSVCECTNKNEFAVFARFVGRIIALYIHEYFVYIKYNICNIANANQNNYSFCAK